MEIITLKNGEKIELQYSFLIMQYLEEYDGGLKKLKNDLEKKINLVKIQSLFIFAAVRANYDEKITFQEAVRLVDMKDLPKINQFYKKNFEEQDNFQKKRKNSTSHKKKKKK